MSRVMPEGWVLPAIDPQTSPFFTTGKLMLQTCTACGTVQHPPEVVCHACQASDFDWREAAGRGTIHSYTIVRHPAHPMLADAIPYAVVLVSLEEHPEVRITGNLPGVPLEDVTIGRAVRAVWEELADPDSGEKLRIPQWELA